MIFDPNMTKKKKKKKKPFMLDEEGGEGMGGEEAKELEAKEAEPEVGEDREVDFDEDDSRKKGLVWTHKDFSYSSLFDVILYHTHSNGCHSVWTNLDLMSRAIWWFKRPELLQPEEKEEETQESVWQWYWRGFKGQ